MRRPRDRAHPQNEGKKWYAYVHYDLLHSGLGSDESKFAALQIGGYIIRRFTVQKMATNWLNAWTEHEARKHARYQKKHTHIRPRKSDTSAKTSPSKKATHLSKSDTSARPIVIADDATLWRHFSAQLALYTDELGLALGMYREELHALYDEVQESGFNYRDLVESVVQTKREREHSLCKQREQREQRKHGEASAGSIITVRSDTDSNSEIDSDLTVI